MISLIRFIKNRIWKRKQSSENLTILQYENEDCRINMIQVQNTEPDFNDHCSKYIECKDGINNNHYSAYKERPSLNIYIKISLIGLLLLLLGTFVMLFLICVFQNSTFNLRTVDKHTPAPGVGTEKVLQENTEYVLNIETRKIHKKDCGYLIEMSYENMEEWPNAEVKVFVEMGYEPCLKCIGEIEEDKTMQEK